MTQTITRGFRTLVAEANAVVETLPVDTAIALHGRDDVVFVDLRDPRELEREGRIPGSFHCPRGMLEFRLSATQELAPRDLKLVLYCKTSGRAALASCTAGGDERPSIAAASGP